MPASWVPTEGWAGQAARAWASEAEASTVAAATEGASAVVDGTVPAVPSVPSTTETIVIDREENEVVAGSSNDRPATQVSATQAPAMQPSSHDIICAVCHQLMGAYVAFWLPCNHCFHVYCVKKWWAYHKQNFKCPVCLTDVSPGLGQPDQWIDNVSGATFHSGEPFIDHSGVHPNDGATDPIAVPAVSAASRTVPADSTATAAGHTVDEDTTAGPTAVEASTAAGTTQEPAQASIADGSVSTASTAVPIDAASTAAPAASTAAPSALTDSPAAATDDAANHALDAASTAAPAASTAAPSASTADPSASTAAPAASTAGAGNDDTDHKQKRLTRYRKKAPEK